MFKPDAFQPLIDAMADDLLGDLALLDLSFIKSVSKPRRQRSFNQRDVTRALRAAAAAGITVRIEIGDGKLILVPVSSIEDTPEPDADDVVMKLK